MENRNVDDKLNRIESRISVMMAGVSAEMADISSDVRAFRQDLSEVQKTRVEKAYLDRIAASLNDNKGKIDNLRTQTDNKVAELKSLIATLAEANAGHTSRLDAFSTVQIVKIDAIEPELRAISSGLSAKIVDWETRIEGKFASISSQIEAFQNQAIATNTSLDQALQGLNAEVATQVLAASTQNDTKLDATTSQLTAQLDILEQRLTSLSAEVSAQVQAVATQNNLGLEALALTVKDIGEQVLANRDELATQARTHADSVNANEQALKTLRASLSGQQSAASKQNAARLESGFNAIELSRTKSAEALDALSKKIDARLVAIGQANEHQALALQQAYRDGIEEATRAIFEETRSLVRQNELVISDFAREVSERDARQDAYLRLTLNKMRPIVYFLHRVRNKLGRMFGPKPVN